MKQGARGSGRTIGLLAALGALLLAALLPGVGLPVEAATGRRLAEGMMQAEPSQQPPVTLLLATEPAKSSTRDPVTFVLALDNPSSGDVTLTYSSAQGYDIVVMSGDTEVWRWSYDKAFAAALVDVTYPAGATLLTRERWDWRDVNGAPVPPGQYRAVASLVTIPPRQGNVVELTLEAP